MSSTDADSSASPTSFWKRADREPGGNKAAAGTDAGAHLPGQHSGTATAQPSRTHRLPECLCHLGIVSAVPEATARRGNARGDRPSGRVVVRLHPDLDARARTAGEGARGAGESRAADALGIVSFADHGQ